jgi:hypothetical protein
MDIRHYPPDWREISLRIRAERARWRCEWCGAVNAQPHPVTGSKVVLTVAHLGTVHEDGTPGDKHDKMDVRPCNLAALCQRCHLGYDLADHIANRRRNREARLQAAGQLRMFEEVSFERTFSLSR